MKAFSQKALFLLIILSFIGLIKSNAITAENFHVHEKVDSLSFFLETEYLQVNEVFIYSSEIASKNRNAHSLSKDFVYCFTKRAGNCIKQNSLMGYFMLFQMKTPSNQKNNTLLSNIFLNDINIKMDKAELQKIFVISELEVLKRA